MSKEVFRVQLVGQLGRGLEVVGWFHAVVIVVTTAPSFTPDFVSDIISPRLSPAEV